MRPSEIWVIESSPKGVNFWVPTRRPASIHRKDVEDDLEIAAREYPNDQFRLTRYIAGSSADEEAGGE